jgi:ABC-2 type transport system ATP-binding protein
VTENTERPRDAALAGSFVPAPVPGSGTAELDGKGDGPGVASPVIRLAGVSCRRGRREALHRIDLEIDPARVTGVLGPNGAGKSTLLGVVAGLFRPFEGTATVLGEQLPARGATLRRRIGVVLQETALYEELTVSENLRLTASLYSLARPAQRITEVLKLIDLADRADDVVTSLSGGMRRRVTLARALLHNPELLIIDEPTLGIDAEARHAIWEHIRLLRARGTTVIVASNYLDEVQALCDIAAVLHEGRLVAYEAPDSLVAQAGQCLDLDCAADSVPEITGLVLALPGVSRAEVSPSGLTMFLRGDADPDAIVRGVLQQTHISGFRVRAADLAEVFRVLDPAGKGTTGG